MEEGMDHVITKLETAKSALDECCYITENEALEDEIAEIENRVTDIMKAPEKTIEKTKSIEKPVRVPPTTDEEIYERWLETLEEENGGNSGGSYSESSSSEREKPVRVPPTTDEEIYERWLKTL